MIGLFFVLAFNKFLLVAFLVFLKCQKIHKK